MSSSATGSCLCGSVRFTLNGELSDVVYCHCAMCQRSGTHFGAYTRCSPAALRVVDTRKLRWFRSSPMARRGFCGKCGSQLFWEPSDGSHVAVSAGSLDQPTGLRGGEHIFGDHIPDYDRPSTL